MLQPPQVKRLIVCAEGIIFITFPKKFGVTINQLRERNKLGRRSLLKVGSVLVIPGKGAKRIARKSFHVVQRGETLLKIAQRYNVSLSTLTEANDMSRRATLYVGKKLVIPRTF